MQFPRRVLKFVGLLLVSGLILAAPLQAASGLIREIRVQYNNIKLVVNGTEVPSDAEPFIYEGRIYVPLRSVAEAIDASITYDTASSEVRVVTKDGSPRTALTDVPLIAAKAFFEEVQGHYINGHRFDQLYTWTYNKGQGLDDEAAFEWMEWDLGGQFRLLEGFIGFADADPSALGYGYEEAEMRIFLDGQLVDEFFVFGGTDAVLIDLGLVDVEPANVLRIEMRSKSPFRVGLGLHLVRP